MERCGQSVLLLFLHLSHERQVKRRLYDDPRYDVVGSSSLREELFNTFLKGMSKPPPEQAIRTERSLSKSDAHNEEDEKRKRREQALKEREEKVKAERNRLDAKIERSKQGMGKEEGERLFRCVVDRTREHMALMILLLKGCC